MDVVLIGKLFVTFFVIGICTFGGGYAMVPLITEEVVKNGWLTRTEIVDFIAVSESTPGPFAINIATYVGIETAGLVGAVSATLGVLLPSFIIIILVAKFYDRFRKAKPVEGALQGIRPAAVGLIGAAVLSIGKTAFLFEGIAWRDVLSYDFLSKVVIFALLLVGMCKKIKPVMLIIAGAILGIISGYLKIGLRI